VVDHFRPLSCGGADAPSNLQWQTIAEGKAKDKWERIGCKWKPSTEAALDKLFASPMGAFKWVGIGSLILFVGIVGLAALGLIHPETPEEASERARERREDTKNTYCNAARISATRSFQT
jgi:hypothetical protein